MQFNCTFLSVYYFKILKILIRNGKLSSGIYSLMFILCMPRTFPLRAAPSKNLFIREFSALIISFSKSFECGE